MRSSSGRQRNDKTEQPWRMQEWPTVPVFHLHTLCSAPPAKSLRARRIRIRLFRVQIPTGGGDDRQGPAAGGAYGEPSRGAGPRGVLRCGVENCPVTIRYLLQVTLTEQGHSTGLACPAAVIMITLRPEANCMHSSAMPAVRVPGRGERTVLIASRTAVPPSS